MPTFRTGGKPIYKTFARWETALPEARPSLAEGERKDRYKGPYNSNDADGAHKSVLSCSSNITSNSVVFFIKSMITIIFIE